MPVEEEEGGPISLLLLEAEAWGDRSGPWDLERDLCFFAAMASAARPTPEPMSLTRTPMLIVRDVGMKEE